MNLPKKPGFWRFLPLVAIVSLATVVTIVFRSHRETENTPQAAALRSQTPHSATASAPNAAPAQAAATTAPETTAAATNTAPRSRAAPAPLPSLALPGNAATTPVPPVAGTATHSPRERALLAKIPDARFRDDVLKLDPDARFRVFKTLAANPPPAADYASLRLTTKGMIYYVCRLLPNDPGLHSPSEVSSPSVAAPAAESVLITQPPVRHSRPGSRNILFLDFGGMDIKGTAWNEMLDGPKVDTYHAKPYDIDGDPTTFSDQEQKNIIEIWERVSEHYSPFDVDVTTERPATFTRTIGHALITARTDKNNVTMPSGDQAGGVGLLNVFGEYDYAAQYSPVFIYYDALGNRVENIAYAVSHELGHNLGLSHMGPGPTPSTADSDFGYYQGHGDYYPTSWAPIMGAGYGKSVVSWTKGDYYDANNHEDELAIISGKLGYCGETAPATLATAAPLTVASSGTGANNGKFGAVGIIRRGGSAHYYAINLATSGSATFKVDPFQLSSSGLIVGNADLKLDLLDAAGTILATSTAGTYVHEALSATVSAQLAPGQWWYLRVSTIGDGNPIANPPTGFTDYGSIGRYTLTTNIIDPNPTLAVALNSNLNWTTEPGSDAEWLGQTTITHDRVSAAQSGSLAYGQATGIVATVEGSGTLSFWWAISAGDTLAFATTDVASESTAVLATTYENTVGIQPYWKQRTFTIINTGTHSFGWTLVRTSYDPPYSPYVITSTAWIDQVTWSPTDLAFTTPAAKEAAPCDNHFTLTFATNKTWTAATDADWLTLIPATSAASNNATLTIGCEANNTLAPRTGHVTITSGGVNRTVEVAQSVFVPLATALGNDFDWQTGGDNNWFSQTITTRAEHPYAARSGIIFGAVNSATTTGQKTWLEATVTGTGTLDFHWKISSEAVQTDETGTWGDILHFYIDGQERAYISGEQDWARYTTAITTSGAHTLRWVYQKDPYLSVGADAAWLDQVAWAPEVVPTLNISPNVLAVPPTKGNFPLIVDSNITWTATTTASWLAITPATGTGHATPNLAYSANTTAKARTGIITFTGGGLTVTSTITQDTGNTLTLDPATRQVPATKGTFTLTVSANTAWTATSNASWLTIAPASGNGAATLTATHAANTATSTRTARITVTSGSTTATCTVTQDAATTGTGGNNNSSGGGGGGAPSLWSLFALAILLGFHAAKRRN